MEDPIEKEFSGFLPWHASGMSVDECSGSFFMHPEFA
jgi:hypothetical protein